MIYIMIFSPIIATSQESSDLRARLEVQEEKLRSLRTLQDFGSTFSPIRGYVNMAICVDKNWVWIYDIYIYIYNSWTVISVVSNSKKMEKIIKSTKFCWVQTC